MKKHAAVIWLWAQRRSIAATLAFAAVVIGLWIERPSLALLIPGAVAFGLLAWSHVRGNHA
jgi:hypothetical protein